MKENEVFFDGSNYRIDAEIRSDPIDWEHPLSVSLCKGLEASTGSARSFFFKKDFRKLTTGLPHFFMDPQRSFDPSTKSGSNLFSLIETYKSDTDNSLKSFVKFLIDNGVLKEDAIKLLKCECKELTLSSGIRCGHCKSVKNNSQRRVSLYHLPEEIKQIFYKPGKVIEGVIFNCIKHLSESGLTIGVNTYLKVEADQPYELDVTVTNGDKTKLLVILSSISPQDSNEKRQIKRCVGLGIKTFFVTTEVGKSLDGIIELKSETGDLIEVFGNVGADPAFPNNLIQKVKLFFEKT